jgi:hypothetical protein
LIQFFYRQTKVETTIGVEPTPSSSGAAAGSSSPTRTTPSSLPLANGGVGEGSGTLTRGKREKSPTGSIPSVPSPGQAAASTDVSLKGNLKSFLSFLIPDKC